MPGSVESGLEPLFRLCEDELCDVTVSDHMQRVAFLMTQRAWGSGGGVVSFLALGEGAPVELSECGSYWKSPEVWKSLCAVDAELGAESFGRGGQIGRERRGQSFVE